MLKRFLWPVLVFAVLLTQIPTAYGVGTSASSAILMDAASGRILYESNANEPRLIASITKLMTGLVALESEHQISEEVTIRPEWAGVEGSSIYLQAGEQVTLETLLYGMLLRSGNDAAVSVAGYCGGDVDAFVAQMNEKAVQLGMKNSHFANPNGLNADGHYSSAYDMALLARACLENETMAKIVATKSITLGTRIFTNHNKLLWRYDGCVGMKTGYTEKAGRTLVSAAQRDGMTLICVTLNDSNDWLDHTTLFEYGFSNYKAESLTTQGELLCQLPVAGSLVPYCPVVASESKSVCLAAQEEVQREIRLNQSCLKAPVVANNQIGEIVYLLNGREIACVPLVTGASVLNDLTTRQGVFDRLFGRLDQRSTK